MLRAENQRPPVRQSREVRGLLGSRRQPLEIGHRQHGIEQHQTFNGEAWRHSTAVATRDVADDVVQRLVPEVIEPRAVVHAVDFVRVSAPDELVEKRVASPATVRDATKLAYCRGTHTPACRITSTTKRAWRSVKPKSSDGLDAILVDHRHNSSAKLPTASAAPTPAAAPADSQTHAPIAGES